MANELVIASTVSVPAAGARRRCRCWSSGQGGRHASPGMNSSMPSITTRTRKRPISGRCGGSWAGRGAGGRAGRRSRRAWSGSTSSAWAARRQAEPAPGGVTRLLRPAGATGMSCILNPAASVQGRQGSGDRGQDAGDQHRAGPDAAGVGRIPAHVRRACGTGRSSRRWPIPPAGPGRWPSCGCGISSTTGRSTCCGFRRRAARAGKSRCGTTWRALSWPMSRRRASRARPRIRRCSGRRNGRTETADRQAADARSGFASWSSGG